MNGLMVFLEEKVQPIGVKIGGQRHLLAVRDGLVLSMPLIIVGSLFLVLSSLPIPGYQEFIGSIFGEEWTSTMGFVVNSTFGVMALISSFGIANSLVKSYSIDGNTAGIISLCSLLLVTPLTKDNGIDMTYMGSKGLFVSLLIGLIVGEIYRRMVQAEIVIKLPDSVPPAVSKSFVALIPAAVCLTFFWVLRLVIASVGLGNLHEVIGKVVGVPLSYVGGGFIGGLVAVLVTGIFWSVGILGWDLVQSVLNPLWLQMLDENRLAFQAGKEIPHILNTTFFNVFVWMGGSGSIIGLAILLMFFSKSKQNKELGKLGFPPNVFNISEPIMFGFPVVMNPLILIPFTITPIVIYIISYSAMVTGIVAKTAGILVPWTMPPIIGGYLATGGHISGAILQLVCLIVSIVIYYPFFRMIDNQYYQDELQG
ncbi:PTS cellobiose transporter subunit IIC [Vagococcus sp. BWB3-3]|uniref:Permease IIC component n=1 Tax=Vagococcus allomyrinae TaxID=2794353 RepID=A0A940PB80_9ENTE|nr:PTS cellobiose transporter subunit IIC [Vagococcus allomyrinae]MBP1039503.1 PTS cellobiose transporter subunit IIC [Vagococcus allomyrinae]